MCEDLTVPVERPAPAKRPTLTDEMVRELCERVRIGKWATADVDGIQPTARLLGWMQGELILLVRELAGVEAANAVRAAIDEPVRSAQAVKP